MAQQRGDVMMITFEDARLIFKNFTGRAGRFNAEGVRSFSVALDDPAQAQELEAQEWNVKWPKPKPGLDEEEDERTPHLPVGLRFDRLPPRVVLISSRSKVLLGEEDISVLDTIDIAKADLVVRSRWWDDDGEWKIKAMLKSLFVWINEDPLEQKYADILAEVSPGRKIEEVPLG